MINCISSIGETLIGFFMIYLYIEDQIPRKKAEITIVSITSVVMGMFLSYSRLFSHVSVLAVLICTLLSGLVFWIIKKEEFVYILSVAWSYYSFASLIQVFYIYWFIGQKTMVEGMYWGIFTNVKALIRQFVYFWSLFITTFLLGLLWRILRRKEVEIKDYKMVLLGFGGAMTVLFVYYREFLQDLSEVEKQIEGVHFITFLTIAVIILLFTLAFLRSRTIEKENAMLQLHDEIVKVRYQELEDAVSKNRQLVHDINNHLIIIQEYAKAEDNEKIYQYIREMRAQYDITSQKRWTYHPVIDFVLNQKKMDAEQNNISFEIKAERGIVIPVSESEICVVLGNLLDNAIEAAGKAEGKSGWIKVIIGKQNEMVFLKIDNNFLIDPILKNGEYITTKENKNAHGYGIKSVKRIIENCDGTISFEAKNHRFSVRIMLPKGEVNGM